MKILILGGSGLVGSYLKKELETIYSVTATSRNGTNSFIQFDLTKEETYSIFKNNYDVIVDCTVDYNLPLNKKLYNDVLCKESFLKYISQFKTHYIAISSVSATTENKFLSDYNFSKYLSDELILFYGKKYNLKFTILRYSQIFDIDGLARKIQPALFYFIDSFRNNKPLNVFGNPLAKRSFIPMEILVETVKKTIHEKIEGLHSIIMPDTYTANDLIDEFGKMVKFDSANLSYQPNKVASEYSIPECSSVFKDFMKQQSHCLGYFKNLLLKKL